ncbi:MAG: PorV/PorQ family protein [Luteibaculaceae bacterium]
MKKATYKIIVSAAAGLLVSVSSVFAGNEDRAGSAGATELLINPWAMSSGMAGANTASVMGIESVMLNVAGLAFTEKTEINYAFSDYLAGSGISINTLGFSQNLNGNGVLGLTAMVMSFGDIDITTAEIPEGGIGVFSPVFVNIGLSYAKMFSESISAGLTVRVINQSIANASASGVGFDAGVRYVTGDRKNIKFGITLRNVGPPMSFGGDGFGFGAVVPGTNNIINFEQRRAQFEIPATLTIGAAYDLYFSADDDDHFLSIAANFQANSFTRDNYMVGLEYTTFSRLLVLRAGYLFEDGIGSVEETATAFRGLAAGFSLGIPSKRGAPEVTFSYSYRATRNFNGIHSLGARINLN